MKEEHIKKIIENLKSGSSLNKNNEVNGNEFFQFMREDSIKAPKNLNEKLWNSFDKKTRKNIRSGYMSVAASVALIISLYIYNYNKEYQSEAEKEALLKEAKSMFLNETQEQNYKKILEDNLVIVYSRIDKN